MPDTTDGNPIVDLSTSDGLKPQPKGDIFEQLLADSVAAARSGSDKAVTTPSAGTQASQGDSGKLEPQFDYKARWKESSEEGIRLHKENETIKSELDESKKLLTQYTPYINALNDPKFLDHVDAYFKDSGNGNAQPQKSVGVDLASFGISEDDVFSPKDLVDPNKPAGRFFQTLVGAVANQVVDGKLSQFRQEQSQVSREAERSRTLATQVSQFLSKHPEMTEQQVYDMIDTAKKRQTTLDDIYLVVNKDEVLKSLASQRRDPNIQSQRMTVSRTPQSMASANSVAGVDTPSPEGRIMASLKRTDDIEKLFNSLPLAGGGRR